MDRDPRERSVFKYNPLHRLSLQRQRERLPIYKHRASILYAIETFDAVIVVGDTGTGKSTQIPQYLHEAGWTTRGHVIACTQPSRVAVVSVASRVAEERGSVLGGEIGFAGRFGEKFHRRDTRIKYMTDGHLIREMMLDPLLRKYSVIMIDEAHERGVFTDATLGLLKKIRRKRKDLRIVVTSATLAAEAFRGYLEDEGYRSTILSISGRLYPVDVLYLERPTSNYLEKAVDTVTTIDRQERSGAILVFMPGAEEVESVTRALRERRPPPSAKRTWIVCPLHASMTFRQQMAVFQSCPRNVRKIVVATNIAETSLTIPGVRYVVDSLFARIPAYDPVTNRQSLIVQPVSKASAMQRSGRAGRVQYGKTFRLCTEGDFESLLVHSVPEMQRARLAWVVLQLKALGIEDVLHFDYISPPPVAALADGLELLFALGAIDEFGNLAEPLGLHMAEFPVEPRLSRMLLASFDLGCSEEALTVAAMLTTRDVFARPGRSNERRKEREERMRDFASSSGDHMSLIRIYRSFVEANKDRTWCEENFIHHRSLQYAFEVRRRLRRYLVRFLPEGVEIASCGEDDEALLRCVLSGFFCNAASLMSNGNYRTVQGNREVILHPTSMLSRSSNVPHWIVFNDVVRTTEEYIREASAINPLWLRDVAPHVYRVHDSNSDDADRFASGKKRKGPSSPPRVGPLAVRRGM